MLYWQPLSDDDWQWVNYGTVPQRKDDSENLEEEKKVDSLPK